MTDRPLPDLLRRGLLAGLAGLALGGARAGQDTEVLELLKRDGTHAIMRHAIAPGTGDPESFRIGDCATQRNLSELGREQARETGRMFRFVEVRFDRVLSSQWCRCLETARLMDVGPVEEEPILNSFFEDRSQRLPQTDALKELLAAVPAGETLLLVTHQVNITALTGVYPRSGEVILFRVLPGGEIMVVGRTNALPSS